MVGNATEQTPSTASLLVSAAILLRQAGYDSKAIELLQEASRVNPACVSAFTLLGAFYQANQEPLRAEEAFRRALEIDPNNAEALQGFGLFLVAFKRYAEAIPYLEKHLTLNAGDSLSLDGYLEALSHLPNYPKEATRRLRKLWRQTQHPEVGVRYGRFLLEQNQAEKAQKVFEEIAQAERTPRNLCELALAQFLNEEFAAAIESLEEALEIDPQFDRAWRGLAQCYNEISWLDEALEAAEQAIAINPNHVRNWLAKAEVLLSMEKYEQVLEACQRGIQLMGDSPENRQEAQAVLAMLYLHRIIALLELGRFEQAKAEVDRAHQEIPQDARFHRAIVLFLFEKDRFAQALEILESLSDPDLKETFAPLQYLLLHLLGRGDEAYRFLRPYLEKDPERYRKRLENLGVHLYKDHKEEPAIAIYRQLLADQPQNMRAANNLAYFLIGAGQFAEAERLLLQVHAQPEAGIYAALAACNLAYLSNLKGEYEKALQYCADVLHSPHSKEEVILRVPFWVKGKMFADFEAIPGREITLGNAALACATSAALALNNLSLAEDNLEKIDKIAEIELYNLLSGCLAAARGKVSKATRFWKRVLQFNTTEAARQTIQHWLHRIQEEAS